MKMEFPSSVARMHTPRAPACCLPCGIGVQLTPLKELKWGIPEELKCPCIAMVTPNTPCPKETDVEGFGMVAVEAGSQGIPLITVDINGLHDAVRHGETSLLIPRGDAGAWQNKIEILMNWGEGERRDFAVGASDAVAKQCS